MARPKKQIEKPTPKQQRFAEQYVIDLDATKATLRAGYKCKTRHVAQVIGYENLLKPVIKNEIERLKAITSEKTGITVEWVVNNLREVAERCLQVNPVLDHDGKQIGEYEFDSGGANRALQLLGMHVNAFDADNKSRTPEQRILTIKELKMLIIDSEKRDKNILEAGNGIVDV